MKKKYRILSFLMAATIAFTSLDVSVNAADIQFENNEESTQEVLGASSNQVNENDDEVEPTVEPEPTVVQEPIVVPEPTADPETTPTPSVTVELEEIEPEENPDDTENPEDGENTEDSTDATEGEEGLEEELLDEELLDEEEEDEEELIVAFDRFNTVTTEYKLALESLEELFPTKIVAYTDKDHEVEFEITEWNDVDDYDKLLGRYHFEPVFESEYEFDEGLNVPNLLVKVKDESEGAKGYVDFDVQKASADENSVAYENLKLPSENSDSYYNAFESGMVPEVRDQGQEGACWAFSTMAAIEANLIKQNMASKDDIDLSELQLVYFTSHDYDDPKDCRDSDTYTIGDTSHSYLDNGGNSTIASQALLNKVGVVEEVYAPYSKGSTYALEDSYAVSRDFAEVTDAIKVDISNVKAVQNAIKKYGAAVASIYATQREEDYLETTKENGTVVSEKQVGVRYSATHNSYYSSASLNSNHSVAIVGWDDSFPKENFHEDYQPESDGAWLIRNSWGLDGYGFRGYFWMSYCDRSLLKGETVTVYSATTDMYDNVYSYASGVNGGYYSPNTTGSSMTAEVEYSVKAGESVEAVTVEVDNTNSSVTVEVTDGKTTSTGTLHNESKGIYTIKLDNPIQVTSDSDIKVKYTIQASADEKPHISYEGSLSNYGEIKLSHNVSCDKGFMLNGYQRVDSDARVKLLTNDTGVVEKGTLELATTRVFDYAGTTHQIEIAEGSVTTNPSDITWSVVDENKATVDADGVITVGNEHGKTVVIGRYTDSQGYDYQVSVLVVVKAYTISYELGDDVYKISLPTSYYPGDSSACRLAETQYSSYYPVAKNGYKFAGWYLDSDFQTQVTSASLLNMTGNITLYPKWDLAAVSIRFYEPLSDGSGYRSYTRYITSIKINQTPFTIPAKGTYDPNSYVAAGKKFDYWSLDPEGNEPITAITADHASFVPKKQAYGYVVGNEEIVLYPQFKDLDNAEVTFDANGGTVAITSKSYPFNRAFGNLPVPTRKGYVFDGWYASKSGGTKYLESTVATAPTYTMYARWTAASYNVTYDANGGTVGTPGKTVTYNSRYGTLSTPVRAGYTFKNWRLNSADGAVINNLSYVTVDSDHKLVATWEARSFDVYFMSNGGTGISASSKKVTYGASYGTLELPTQTGYEFTGWHLDSVDGELITSESIVSTASTIYLYASWEPKQFTVTFNANGGTVEKESITVAYNSAFGKLPVPTREGYKFNGWFANTTNTYNQYTETTKYSYNYDIAIYAQWTPLTYKVTLDANGGTISTTTRNVTFDSSYGTISEPTRVGYTFKNWHLNTADGAIVTSGSIVNTAENHKLVAEWAPVRVTVSFDINGGGRVDTSTKNVYFDATYGQLPEPVRDGYVFAGWFTSANGGTKVSATTKVAILDDQTLYAHWTAKKYKVIYKLDTKDGVAPKTKEYEWTFDAALPTVGTISDATRLDYIFTGWYYDEECSEQVNATDLISVDKENYDVSQDVSTITIYAKWTDVPPVNVNIILNANTGNIIVSDEESVAQIAADKNWNKNTYSFAYDLNMYKKGYRFVAWHLNTIKGARVTPDDTITTKKNHKLIAEWEKLHYTIELEPNGGELEAWTSPDYVAGNKIGTLPSPSMEGYEFGGWFWDEELTDPVSEVGVISDNDANNTVYTIYAKWNHLKATNVTSSVAAGDVEKGTVVELSTTTEGATIYYTLDGTTPTTASKRYTDGIVIGKLNEAGELENRTVNIVAFADKDGYEASEPVSFAYNMYTNNWGDIKEDEVKALFQNDSSLVPDGIWYLFVDTDSADSYAYYTSGTSLGLSKVYNGDAITFSDDICVYHGKTKLVEKRDYTISYANNKVAATNDIKKAPTVTITGKGNYASKGIFKFNILQADLADAELSSEENVSVFIGKTVKITNTKPAYKYNGKALTNGKDYVLKYYKDVENENGELVETEIADAKQLAKEYVNTDGCKYYIKAVATGKAGSNFTGEVTKKVVVTGKDKSKSVQVSGLKVYNAQSKTLVFTYDGAVTYDLDTLFSSGQAIVKDGKKVLEYGVDYEVQEIAEMDYHSAGTHSFRVVGLDRTDFSDEEIAAKAKSYTGSKVFTFTIKGTAFNTSNVKFAGLLGAVEYTGTKISYQELFNANDKVVKTEGWTTPTLYVNKKEGKVVYKAPLTEGTDYDIEIKNNGGLGSFTVVYTGKNGYTGTIKKTVKINAYNIAKDLARMLSIETSDAEYVKTGAKPAVVVKFGETTLKEGVDYTLSYKNNGKIVENYDTLKANARPAVIIKGKGNFTGTNANTYFNITKASISNVSVVVSDVVYNAKGKAGYFMSANPALKDDDKAISIGKNREVEAIAKGSYRYTYADETELVDGTVKKAGATVSKTDKVGVGTLIKVSVYVKCSEKSPYTSAVNGTELVGYYRIIEAGKNISSYSIKINDQAKITYSDSKNIILLKESDITLSYKVKKDVITLNPSDYEIVSIKNNKLIGKATIVLKGKGEYGGTKSYTFNIKARSFK